MSVTTSDASPPAAGNLKTLALGYVAGGLSLVPCSPKTKQPEFSLLPRGKDGKPHWEQYQTERATAATVEDWFNRGCQSVAAVGGSVSGGLLVIDFDVLRFYHAWLELVGCLADGLPTQRTGREGGGFQVWFRCPEPGKSEKLAWVPDEAEETGRRTAIETKAEGGYAVAPGSLHPSGRRYEAVSGDFANIPTRPQAVADALLAAARKLDETPLTQQQADSQAEESTAHRAHSNGQASVIDAYNQQHTIVETLKACGYKAVGDRYARPKGTHASVTVRDGKSFHHHSDDPLSDRYWHRPFDLFCHYNHRGDCSAAVRAAAEELGISYATTGQKDKPRLPATADELAELGVAPSGEPAPGVPATDQKAEKVEFRRITCAELDQTHYHLEYLIDRTLVAGQPCIIAGGKKNLKTSLVIDMGISLAMGGFFLGKLKVNRACRVGIMSGESGMATIQETARRIARAAGYCLSDISGLVFCETLPQFENITHMDALKAFITEDELEVIVFDPAYMTMSGQDAGNLFVQGATLRLVNQVCAETGCTMILVHHTRKGGKANPFDPPELEDIAWAGFQEWCRQWVLVGRRERYEPGSGLHRLWLNAGGSAGHSALWALDVSEGTYDGTTQRQWDVSIMQPDEARQDAKSQEQTVQQQRHQAKAEADLEADRREIVAVVAKLKTPETKNGLRDRAFCGHARFDRAFASLTSDGTLEPGDVVKANGQNYAGWRLKNDPEV